MVLICKVTLSVRRGKGGGGGRRQGPKLQREGFSYYFCVGEGDCRVNLICSSRIMIGKPLPPLNFTAAIFHFDWIITVEFSVELFLQCLNEF